MPTAILVANARSGVRELGPRRVDKIAAALASRGIELAGPLSVPLAEQLARTTDPEFDLVVVAGGDGTVRAVAPATAGAPRPIAILPFGTMNMLAKELGLPLHPDKAIELVGSGRTKRIDVAVIDGELFLHSALMGLPVRVGTHREHRRGVLALFDKVMIALHAIATTRRDPKLTLTALAGGHSSDGPVTATSIVALIGEPSEELFPVPRRARVDAGHLTFFAIAADTAPTIVRSILHEAVGALDSDENVRVLRAPAAKVESPRRKIHVLLDGERHLFNAPLTIEIRPKAQPMIVP